MLATIGIGLLVLIAVLAVVVATRPAPFHFERSATIAAPAGVVFPYMEDFHRWKDWVTYDRMDPNIERTFSGPAQGVGATYHFRSAKVGEGRFTIQSIEPGRRVAVEAEFIKPMKATNLVEMTLRPAPEPGSVVATWSITGRNGFVGKAFALCVNMDRMMGRDFETGLAELKRVTEAEAHQPAATA